MALRPKANDKIKDNEYFLKSIQDGFTEKKIVEGIRKMIPASEQSPPKPEEPESKRSRRFLNPAPNRSWNVT